MEPLTPHDIILHSLLDKSWQEGAPVSDNSYENAILRQGRLKNGLVQANSD